MTHSNLQTRVKATAMNFSSILLPVLGLVVVCYSAPVEDPGKLCQGPERFQQCIKYPSSSEQKVLQLHVPLYFGGLLLL